MTGGRYAETTSVPVGRTHNDIVAVLRKYEAAGFMFGEEGDQAAVAFRIRGRHVRFTMPLPDPQAEEFWTTPSGKWSRTDAQAKSLWEQAVRARWRGLKLIIQAKLEAVAAGVVEFDVEFMAQIVMPNGRTVGESVAPQLAAALEGGTVPALMPGGSR